MKWLMHPALTALGLSVLCFLGFIGPLINPNHLWIYQDSGSPASVFVPVLLNVGFVWLVITLLLMATRKPGRVRVLLWTGLFFAVPLMVLEDGAQLNAWTVRHWLSRALILASFVCWCALVALLRPPSLPWFERARRFAQTVLAFASLGAVIVLGQAIGCFWQARGLQTPRPLHSSSRVSRSGSPQRPRVIWIILDELSYQQVYERRFASLELPAFDRLAGESTLFTQVQPAAEYTEYAVPSLITGLRADRIRAGADGNLLALHNPLTGEWQPFRPENTVFADALDQGYSTAVAGWYIPYCRIFATVLDRCSWTFRPNEDSWMLSEASMRVNTLAPWIRFASVLHSRYHDQLDSLGVMNHIADYETLVSDSDKLLDEDDANFILLHLPVPHPGGIYNRRTGAFATRGASYVDNLALADRYLAHVRQLLAQRGEWDSSAVIVMGDHSWRTSLIWSSTPLWTAEEQAASHGGLFDDRPAYIVKLPHQTQPARIETPFDAVNTRALLDAILSGRIQSPAELAALAANPQAQRPPNTLAATLH